MKTLSKEKFGTWAIVTGASSGIGAEFAHQLAASGLNLVLVARRKLLLENLGQELAKKHNIKYRIVMADLSEEAAVDQVIHATDDLDVGLLISNAGTGRPGKFISHERGHLMSIVQLNALSHLTLVHHFGRKMAASGKGGILLTGAMGAIDGLPYMANESGTKALVQAFGKALHVELKESGVNLTVLVTTPTETPVLPMLGFTKSNMPTKPISVEVCVSEALHALTENRMTVMPGRKFRIMNAIVPAAVSRNMMAKIFKQNNNIN